MNRSPLDERFQSPLDERFQGPKASLYGPADDREMRQREEWPDYPFYRARLIPSEGYGQGTHELHVHFISQSLDYCAISRAATEREIIELGDPLSRCGVFPSQSSTSPSLSHGQESPVLVGDVVSVQPDEGMILGAFAIDSRFLVGLRPLNVCPRFREHLSSRIGEPLPVGWVSLDIATCAVTPPGVLKIDREVDEVVLPLRRIECHRDVVKSTGQVEEEIADQETPGLVRFAAKINSVGPFPWALLALDPFADRVFASSCIGGDKALEFDEVFLCPVEFGLPSSVGMDPSIGSGGHGSLGYAVAREGVS